MDAEREQAPRAMLPGAIIAGVLMLAVGIGMLLDRSGWLGVSWGELIAPAALIAIGTGKVLGGGDVHPRRRRGSLYSGFWLIGVGVWLGIIQTGAFGFDAGNGWPLLVIMSGVMLLMRGLR
jgi:hypothetical protein